MWQTLPSGQRRALATTAAVLLAALAVWAWSAWREPPLEIGPAPVASPDGSGSAAADGGPSDPGSDTDAESDAEPEPDTDTDTETESDPESDTESDTEPEPVTDTGSDTEPDPDPGTETESDTEPDPDPDTETESDPEPEPEPDPDPDSESDEPVTRADAPIDLQRFADRRLDESPFTVAASTEPGLTIQLSTDSAACRVSGTRVELLHTGRCRIVASHRGSDAYDPASTAAVFTVTKGRQVIDLPNPGQVVFPYASSSVQLRATSSAGLPVTFVPDAGTRSPGQPYVDDACVVTASGSLTLDTGSLPITCAVSAEHTGNDDWLPATAGPVTFEVPALVTDMGLDGQPQVVGGGWTVRIWTDGLGISTSRALTDAVCRVTDWQNVGDVGDLDEGRHEYEITVAKLGDGTCRIEASSELDGYYFDGQRLTVTMPSP